MGNHAHVGQSVNRCVMWAIVFFSLTTVAGAQKRTCLDAEAKLAEESSDDLKTWRDLHVAFTRFRTCDDGAVTEAWSDTVARLLSQRWDTLKDLQELLAKDRAFHSFVIRHIDATAAPADLQNARLNATGRCPRTARPLCTEIVKAAQAAEREQTEKSSVTDGPR